MELLLKRIVRNNDRTIGELYINGVFFCHTLEDTDRFLSNGMDLTEIIEKKIDAMTAIPTGLYKLIVSYSPRFKALMPLLLNVKGFLGIRIHTGNKPEDSEGCILVGIKDGNIVKNSKITYNKLLKILSEANKKEVITIKII